MAIGLRTFQPRVKKFGVLTERPAAPSLDGLPTPHNLRACFADWNDPRARSQCHKKAFPVTVITCGSRSFSVCAVLTIAGAMTWSFPTPVTNEGL
jgi:hypothetical protein